MKPLGTIVKPIGVRVLLVCLVSAIFLAACAEHAESPTSLTLPPNHGYTTTTADGLSVVDLDPMYSELGGWWLVPQVDLVLRGHLTEIVDRYQVGGNAMDIWELKVDEVLLGQSGSTVRVARYPSAEIAAGLYDDQLPWSPGDEGIFFLTPAFGSDAVPDLHVAIMGSIGVVTSDLDYWSSQIPRANEALGLSLRSAQERADVVIAVRTELVVEGVVESVSTAKDLLGWGYLKVDLSDVIEVWAPTVNAPEEGVPPSMLPQLSFIVGLDSDVSIASGDRVRVMLRDVILPDPVGSTWLAVHGSRGLLDPVASAEELVRELDQIRAMRDELINEWKAKALEVLRPIVADAGRIPLVSDPEPVIEPLDPAPLYRSPLSIQKDGIEIIFDRWFFVVLDGMAQVTVRSSTGEVLAEGPVEGSQAIMRELPDNSFEFVNDEGEVVATLSQAELSEAAMLAYQEFQDTAADS